jgi:hypothetical protein
VVVTYIAFDIYMTVTGNLHYEQFTSSALVLFTVYQAVQLVALIVRRGLLTFVLRFVLPFALGPAMVVAVLIVIIIALYPDIYLSATIYGGGSNTLSEVHTGDWLLHNLPMVAFLAELFCGLGSEIRDAYRGAWLAWGAGKRSLHAVLFLVAGLLPFVLYGCFQDPRERYSITMPAWAMWIIIVVIVFAVMMFMLAGFTLDSRYKLTADEYERRSGGTRPLLGGQSDVEQAALKLPVSGRADQLDTFVAQQGALVTAAGSDGRASVDPVAVSSWREAAAAARWTGGTATTFGRGLVEPADL